MSTANTDNTHKTTQQAIEIMDCVRRANGASISELLSNFDMSRSTMYTHLNTLTKAGLVVRENGQYWVGLRFKQFSAAAMSRKPSYQLVENELRQLEDETNSEIEFLVEESGRLNVIYHSENITDDRVHLHLHNTAAGKAILAELPEAQVSEILDRHGLPRQTENTITDRAELFDQLDLVSERGYAYNDSECFKGYHGIGATVQGINGDILGGVTIGGPVYRLPEERLRNELLDVLLETIERIEDTIESHRSFITTELASSQ